MVDFGKHYTSLGTFSSSSLLRIYEEQGRKFKGKYLPVCVSEYHEDIQCSIKNLIFLFVERRTINKDAEIAESILKIISILISIYDCKQRRDVDDKLRDVKIRFSKLNIPGPAIIHQKYVNIEEFENSLITRMSGLNQWLDDMMLRKVSLSLDEKIELQETIALVRVIMKTMD